MFRIFFFVAAVFAAAFCFADVVEEVVARVGDEIITKTEYDMEARRMYDVLSRQVQGDELQKQFETQKAALLDFIIDSKLLEQKAKELNVDVDDEVKAAILRLEQENNIPNDQALAEALSKEGTTMADLKADFRKRVIQQKVLWNYVQGKVNITEDEIKSYYEKHKAEVMSTASTKIRRYIISGEGTDDATLKIEADSVVADLRAGKELKDGDYPHLKVADSAELQDDELNPKFLEAIQNMTVGSYTDPIETSNGWSVLKVEDRKEAKPIAYDEARGKIYQLLLQERAEKYQKSFLEDLRKHSYVVVLASGS
jgi:peptidyl-prolyl cis-trans isomerase SurA